MLDSINESVLSKCLLDDTCFGIIDVELFGSYATNVEGNTTFVQGYRRIKPIEYKLPEISPETIDNFISKVLFSVANHAHRKITVYDYEIESFIRKSSHGVTEIFSGIKDLPNYTSSIPQNHIIKVTEHPEHFGRLFYSDNEISILIHNPVFLEIIEFVKPTSSNSKPKVI